MVSACQENVMSNEVNVEVDKIKVQRFIELKVDSSGIDYYIDFNDIKVFSEVAESPVNQVIPVNHWVVNGDNKLLVSVNYQDKVNALKLAQSAELTISVMIRIKRGDTQQSYTLTKFDLGISDEQLTRIEKGDIEFSLENKDELIASKSWQNIETDLTTLLANNTKEMIKLSSWIKTDEDSWTDFNQVLSLNLGYPEWAYLKADNLGNSEEMTEDEFYGLSDELYLEYKKVWQLMKDKNKDALLPLFSLRASEFDAAYYLPKGEKLADMDNSLTSAFEHEDLYLDKIVPDDEAQLTIEGNGKIAILKIAEIATPLIYYSHVRGAFHRSYTLYFMRKDGKWTIIR